MTSHEPPRLALVLLERFVPDSAPIAGDLIEEFDRRPSRAWFWYQVLGAIVSSRVQQADVIRPLQLVDLQPSDALERSRAMTVRFKPVNMTASPVHGVGGLGLVALSMFVGWIVPGVWLVLLGSMVAGVLLGCVMIARRGRATAHG